MRTGRPKTPKAQDETEAKPLDNPGTAPGTLSPNAQTQWLTHVPNLHDQGLVIEADRMMLCVLCQSLADFYSCTSEDTKEKRLLIKSIMDLANCFGLTPLARMRSGVKKKAAGIKQRP